MIFEDPGLGFPGPQNLFSRHCLVCWYGGMGFLVLLIISLIKFIKTRRKQEFVYNPSRSRLPESGLRAARFGEFIQDAKICENTRPHQAYQIPPYQAKLVSINFEARKIQDPDLRKSSVAPTSEIFGMVVFWYEIFIFQVGERKVSGMVPSVAMISALCLFGLGSTLVPIWRCLDANLTLPWY
jgi:hypothetical protein